MSIGQNNNRGKFIVFESNSVRLNNNIFPTQNINVSLNASLQDSLDINGDLIGYAPNGPVQGSASFSFDLTGALPSYFNITGLSEEPTLIKFNTFVMYGYLQNLKYNVRPYQPITVDADFAFFHGIKYLNSDRQDPVLANFDNTLKTYNGVRSYVLTDLSNNFTPLSFTYSLSAERVPYTKVGYESPTRVALENVRAEMVVEGNNLDDYLTIRGNDRRFVGVLNELYEYKPIDRISLIVDGKVVDQSFAIDSNSYGLSQLKLIQTLPKNRNIITIPFVDSETVFTSTTDRVYTLPDFAAVCPSIIRREQPVDGGGTPGDTPVVTPPDVDPDLTYIYYKIYIGPLSNDVISQSNSRTIIPQFINPVGNISYSLNDISLQIQTNPPGSLPITFKQTAGTEFRGYNLWGIVAFTDDFSFDSVVIEGQSVGQPFPYARFKIDLNTTTYGNISPSSDLTDFSFLGELKDDSDNIIPQDGSEAAPYVVVMPSPF
jgi:hypothetical protein